MPKLYRIELSENEREALSAFAGRKNAAAHKVCKARSLLLSDEGSSGPALSDKEIVSKTGITLTTLERLRKRCHEVEPLEALAPVQRTHIPRKPTLDGDKEARLVHLVCSEPPAGCARWTLVLLADKMIELEIVDHICPETVRKALKKMSLSLG